ncbi:histidine phosphatase family protein [Brachybacterium paraconglomeratum]|uniref:histidine phosphatase family protein n=1 Tax=Brachybacterium paraconglomeratum TaxID=173362 RepID=UPI003FCFEC06
MQAAHPVLVLRHGESTANVEGRIVSVPGPRALETVGLTGRGREQARAAATDAAAQGLGPGTVVVTSDFARARQTAEEFAAGLGAGAPRVDERLRERCFGAHDEGPATAYEGIWARDRARESHEEGVEPVAEVASRVLGALRAADALAADAPVVLVAHGDVLQIALALAAGHDPHDHREVPHLGNAELRALGPHRTAAAVAPC